MTRYSALGLILLLNLSGCTQAAQDVRETRFLLGTLVEFTIHTKNKQTALEAISKAAQVMRQVENAFTIYGDVDNTVKQFNQADVGQAVRLAPEVDKLLLQSINIHQQSDGAFDPTLGILNKLWGFSGEHPVRQPPTDSQIRHALAQSGAQHIQKTGQGWVKDVQGLALDFGAIAKGYAIDQGIQVFKQYGFTQAIINAGGDMRILGKHGDKPWRIAIRHPRGSQPLGWLRVEHDTSIVTSGDYERFYIYQGQRYHHILNPETGKPAKKSQSVTVIAPTATLADAWSTALFVLGSEQGLKMLKGQEKLDVLWVNADASLSQTHGFPIRDLAHKTE